MSSVREVVDQQQLMHPRGYTLFVTALETLCRACFPHGDPKDRGNLAFKMHAASGF